MNLEAYDRNRNLLYNGLKDLGFSCIKPEGAFYLFVKSPEADEKEFCAKLQEVQSAGGAGQLLCLPGICADLLLCVL